jgi:hypothetical protein
MLDKLDQRMYTIVVVESLEGRPTAETRYAIARLVTAAQAVVSEGGWDSHKTAAESAIGCSGCAMCELKAAIAALNGEGG